MKIDQVHLMSKMPKCCVRHTIFVLKCKIMFKKKCLVIFGMFQGRMNDDHPCNSSGSVNEFE